MNTIVFNKLSGAVLFEDGGAPERERGGRPYGGVLDSPHARPEVGIPDGPPLKDNLGLRHRRTGARQNGGKVRHKRQALQDMARPLKQWLYKHRDNPYPTKTEKILLALGSQMTLVQTLDNGSNKGDSAANRKGPSKDDTYWKEINAAMALTNLAQGKDKLQGTTSCIIQKSSHIAEVKTVKVPLVQQF
uniref:Mohawk homeobox n=1 Tax=Propithecus coquereli TaxID=379532 RepID=A0A2K6FLW8_PROCO